MPLTINTVLHSRYRILCQLAEGGMGTVYKALDERLDITVALKESHFVDERLSKQFEREAQLLAKLRHAAMTRVIDHFKEGHGQYLVMDYVDGDDLSETMKKKVSAFSVEEILAWGDQLLDVLSYLHRQKPSIIHRDIKPQNLKLSESGQIILLDFGLAKGFAGQISGVTKSRSIFGYTPNFAPLEQIEGHGTDARSDLYALGATLYNLSTAKVPPDALTRASANIREASDPLTPANELNPAIPVEVAQVLERAMAQNPLKRFASASEMRAALWESGEFLRSGSKTVLAPSLTYDSHTPEHAAHHRHPVEPTIINQFRPSSPASVTSPEDVKTDRDMKWIIAEVAFLVLALVGIGIWVRLGHRWNGGRNAETTNQSVAALSPSAEATNPISRPTTTTPTPTPTPTRTVQLRILGLGDVGYVAFVVRGVTLTVNGKTYKQQSNSKGVVTFNNVPCDKPVEILWPGEDGAQTGFSSKVKCGTTALHLGTYLENDGTKINPEVKFSPE
ncbi:MAG: serine/threonine protein kinase [Pyrinomonadaceae bacterium]